MIVGDVDVLEPVTASASEEEVFLRYINRAESPCDYEKQLLKDQSQRVLAVLAGKIVPPYELEIQPSAYCNLKCKHCFGRFYDALPDVIDWSVIEKVAEDVRTFKTNGFVIETVKFCGTTGEPLANKVTAPAIERFKGIGKKVILFTNGVLLDGVCQNGTPYIDYVLMGDRIVLSLDAGSGEVFKELKGVDVFPRVVKNLENLVARKREIGSKLNTVISYVIGKENCGDIVNAARIVKNAGADEIRYRVDFTNIDKIRGISKKIKWGIREASKYSNDNFKVISVYSDDEIAGSNRPFFAHEGERRCYNYNFWACIGPNGEVYPCGHKTFAGSKSYGSILDHSLQEIWGNGCIAKVTSSLPDEKCSVCSPSSMRRNDFMNGLMSLDKSVACSLCKKHCGK
jgi:radical SAM protein with 4Fe4S-binding SPASM domain